MLHINLDGGELPMKLLASADGPRQLVDCDASEVEVLLLQGGMASGKHSMAIAARLPDGGVAMIQMSAQIFLNAAAAIRGRLVHLGVIPTAVNPALCMMADAAAGKVHFALEAPLQSWDYTMDEAKKFWRELRRITNGG
jgi:hypothetical protein